MPLELLTFIGTFLLGAITKMWAMKLEANAARDQALIRATRQRIKDVQNARKVEDEGFKPTRRVISIAVVFSVILLPKLIPFIDPTIPITVGYHELNPGFLFLPDKEAVVWQTVTGGYVHTPLDTHAVMAVLGLFFGVQIKK